MPNFTGSWARAASQPMPGAVNSMGLPGAGDGTGGGPSFGPLRPKTNPSAGLNEKPATGNVMNDMLTRFMHSIMGMKMPLPKPKPAAPAPAAGLDDPNSTPNRMDRASRLLGIGAGLMD